MASQTNAPLPDGLEIGGYRIVRRIASGGFSIVYLVEDEQGESFALKEFLPSSLVRRRPGELVAAVSESSEVTFRNGLKCFFEEGRALAKIFHPNVVRVLNFFRANETVYMVMAYEQGRSLQEIVLRHRSRSGVPVMPERHVARVFDPVMSGLREVHANRLLHLDIKPANIYIRMDGSPLLLDFGAARRGLDTDGPKLFPMYTPGFAAPELYRRTLPRGPWSDIYSLGASMYACLTGAPPQPADQRELDDQISPKLEKLIADGSNAALIDLIAWCLKLNPIERPQSVFTLQRSLRRIALDKSEVGSKAAPQTRKLRRWLDTIATRRSTESGDDASSTNSP